MDRLAVPADARVMVLVAEGVLRLLSVPPAVGVVATVDGAEERMPGASFFTALGVVGGAVSCICVYLYVCVCV